jgi:8-amino-7-oxononanoate synthase
VDIFDKCRNFTRAKETQEAGIYPYFIPLSSNDGPKVRMNNHEVIMIGSNNYLGLTHDPRVIEAACKATLKYGSSCSGSRFLNGTLDLHLELEDQLAQFTKREAALTFSTGFQTNMGALSTLASKDDVIILDKADHASIYAGAMSSQGAIIRRYRHNDMSDLKRILSSLDPNQSKIIVSDGVFSMEGDIVKLPELVSLAKKCKARIYIDEAHGLGVLGEHGRGSCEHLGLENEVDIIMSTFSKSLGSIGGFVSGPRAVIDYIKHKASPLIFSAAPTPAATAVVLTTLDIIKKEPSHIKRLQDISKKMRIEFKEMGFNIGESKDTPIIPLYIGDDEKTFLFWRKLFDAGVFANAVISPAVPPGSAMIRTSFMSSHKDDDLQEVLKRTKIVGKNLGII